MEDGGEDAVSDHCAVELIGVVGAKPLGVSGPSLFVTVVNAVGIDGAVGVRGLTYAGGEGGEAELVGVDGAAPCRAHLLAGAEGELRFRSARR